MKKLILLILLLSIPRYGFCTDIYYLKPVELFPGSEVAIFGKDFNENTVVVFGSKAIKPHSISSDRLLFFIPNNTEPGLYLTTLKTDRKEVLPSFSLFVKSRDFLIKNFQPQSVNRCTEEITNVTVEGENLDMVKKLILQGSHLNFSTSKNKLNFELPASLINRNSYLNIYFYNHEEKIKDIITININNKPLIESVEIADNDLTSITLRIRGKNFIHPAKLFVNNELIKGKSTEITTRDLSKSSPMLDRFELLSCREIVYRRYPPSSESKELLIYLENPTGEKSNTFSITVP